MNEFPVVLVINCGSSSIKFSVLDASDCEVLMSGIAEYIEVEPEQKTGHRIKEELFYPSNEEKMRLLQTLIEEEWPDRAIIFANTKHRCEEIWGHLAADGHRVGLLACSSGLSLNSPSICRAQGSINNFAGLKRCPSAGCQGP